MNFKETIKDVLKKYFLISFLIFLISFLMGVLFVFFFPNLATKSLTGLKESFSFLLNLGPFQLGLFIFINNNIKIFISMILGLFFVFPTLFFLTINGFVLGWIATISLELFGAKNLFSSLFYHGFFELLALFISSSFGIWMGVTVFSNVKNYKKEDVVKSLQSSLIKKSIKMSLIAFFLIIVPLLFLAAVIETFLFFYL